MSEFPKLDPITNREMCRSCWNNVHRVRNIKGQLEDACDGECDCVHRSEATWAAIERKTIRDNRAALKKRAKEQLEDKDNPLRADNTDYKKKYTGKAPA